MSKRTEGAIDRLAALFEYGELLLATDPTELILLAVEEIEAARQPGESRCTYLSRRLVALRAEKKRRLQSDHGIGYCECCSKILDLNGGDYVAGSDEDGCAFCRQCARDLGDLDSGNVLHAPEELPRYLADGNEIDPC